MYRVVIIFFPSTFSCIFFYHSPTITNENADDDKIFPEPNQKATHRNNNIQPSTSTTMSYHARIDDSLEGRKKKISHSQNFQVNEKKREKSFELHSCVEKKTSEKVGTGKKIDTQSKERGKKHFLLSAKAKGRTTGEKPENSSSCITV
jgi:hypothetical protein